MREKLIELHEGSLRYAGDVCGETGDCSKCQYDKYGANCGYAIRADYLIANGVTIAKWIPVTERLPEVAITHNNRWEKSTESVHVLCYCKQKSGKRMVKEGSCKVYANGTIYWAIPGTIDSVTHWMPLPEPPKGE